MNTLQNVMQNMFRGSKKQGLYLLGSVLLVMLVIIVTISVVAGLVINKGSYENLESNLVAATKKYMSDYPNNLPTETNPTVAVDTTTLIENKYMKSIQKYVKDASCTANVNVYYNNGNYKYLPFVTCNNFKTKLFSEKLKSDNVISAFGEGLYEMNGELVYRGQNPNNFLEFAGSLWRIVKVNKAGQFIIIKNELESKNYGNWDDRYNAEADSQKGNNTFQVSRALSILSDIYKEEYTDYESYLTAYDVCVGKRNESDLNNSGAIECSSILNNQKISLLPLYDYINASLDSLCVSASSRACQNYNYLVINKDRWWTATGDAKNTYNVYYINNYGKIESESADTSSSYRYTLALDSNTLYKSGTGTEQDPYIIRKIS